MLAIGFLTRGGVTIGDLYHKENIIFGLALNEAVSLEKEANYPRMILCSSKLIEQAHGWNSTFPRIVTDPIGREVVNFFIPMLNADPETMSIIEDLLDISIIRNLIDENIEKFSPLTLTKLADPKKYEKWHYLRSLMLIQLEKIGES